jgi:NAD(P)-dependent dehydrogenase (short-subunit alcohol dehydrogenase family)
VLVNNAGVNANFDLVEMTSDEWDAFFAVDLKAAWLTTKHTVPRMRAAGRGAIVNVSSIHGFTTIDGFFPYAAAKPGLIGLTRTLALELGPAGIRVNAVCPGFTRPPRRLSPAAVGRGMSARHAPPAPDSGTPGACLRMQ